MVTNTKILFCAVLKAVNVDCVCDIGSRDGDQSILFRQLCPKAAVLAFEANPINFKAMCDDQRMRDERIEILPFAVSNARGIARFHVTDVDYTDPETNKGTSSLLLSEDIPIRDTVEVETRRIDEFIISEFSHALAIGLWVDVEGAEYYVLDGMSGIKDRVVVVHVETAKVPLRRGQKTLAKLTVLMESLGFAFCGSNIQKTADWGDVVYVNRRIIRDLGFRFSLCKLRGHMGVWVPVDHVAEYLKSRYPAAYLFFRRLYLKIGT
jgi:FkbM family methyltransferase